MFRIINKAGEIIKDGIETHTLARALVAKGQKIEPYENILDRTTIIAQMAKDLCSNSHGNELAEFASTVMGKCIAYDKRFKVYRERTDTQAPGFSLCCPCCDGVLFKEEIVIEETTEDYDRHEKFVFSECCGNIHYSNDKSELEYSRSRYLSLCALAGIRKAFADLEKRKEHATEMLSYQVEAFMIEMGEPSGQTGVRVRGHGGYDGAIYCEKCLPDCIDRQKCDTDRRTVDFCRHCRKLVNAPQDGNDSGYSGCCGDVAARDSF